MHTSSGSVTFLYSQPIAGLQVLTSDGEWRNVRHYPNHIIADLGDCMDFVTGGILKASPHRGKLLQKKYSFVSLCLTLQTNQSRNLPRIRDSEKLYRLAFNTQIF